MKYAGQYRTLSGRREEENKESSPSSTQLSGTGKREKGSLAKWPSPPPTSSCISLPTLHPPRTHTQRVWANQPNRPDLPSYTNGSISHFLPRLLQSVLAHPFLLLLVADIDTGSLAPWRKMLVREGRIVSAVGGP